MYKFHCVYLSDGARRGEEAIDEDDRDPHHGGEGQAHAEPLRPARVVVGAVIGERLEGHPASHEDALQHGEYSKKNV